jgi:hypothetical protein
MSRAQLREFMALFVVGSALTVAVFFLALWLCRCTHNSSHKQTEKSLRFSVCFFF